MKRTAYPELVNFRVPSGVIEALETGASKARCSRADFARRVLVQALASAGLLREAEEAARS